MSERQIYLDQSKETQPPDGFTIVETEIEFLQKGDAQRLWARGAVCDYVRAVCQARKIKVTETVSPRLRLRALIGDAADTINSAILNRSLEILDGGANPKKLSELLFHLTRDEFWTQTATVEHAARFLTIEFDENLADLVEKQRQIWCAENPKSNLSKIYRNSFAERENVLREWLFETKIRQILGDFPLRLSGQHGALLSDEISRRMRSTDGALVSEFPKQSINKEIYAKAAVEYFSVNTTRLTAHVIAQISPLLSSTQRTRLERLLPIAEIAPLAADADFPAALKWATEKYLPFRLARRDAADCAEADRLAESFADWMLDNYPKLTALDRETSPLNLRAFYTVKTLLEKGYWVLWTVIDGLSYENHQNLLPMLGEKSADLRVAESSAVIAVLPTITERAKYGLTTGKFPQESVNRNWNHRTNFLNNFPDGVYAGDTGTADITEGLQRETPTVCYWNYMAIDKCHHEQTDLTFLKYEVDTRLRGLADKINHLVSTAEEINRVAVVVCSDHGQMINNCRKFEFDLTDEHAHGRTVLHRHEKKFSSPHLPYIKTNNGETVELNPVSFRLGEPTTVALGSTYFVDRKATGETGAIGVHGGLYPEEAVVGLAVLMREPTRKKISASISGTGESGNSGTIKLQIDNPNLAPVNPLSLEIERLEVGEQGELLLAKVSALSHWEFEMKIEKYPAATDSEEFELKGILHYEYDDGTPEQCAVTGNLTCQSLYTSKNPSLLGKYKK